MKTLLPILGAAWLLSCASTPALEAHLAISPHRAQVGQPRFAACDDCPVLEYTTPTGVSRSITVSPDPIYVLRSHDIDRLEIYEHRSPDILGARSFLVVAHPSAAWRSETETVRDAYPHDEIAWLDRGRPLVITFNVNRLTVGRYRLALFACEDDAIEFAARMGHTAPVIRESDEEYEASVAKTNARNAEMLEMMRSNPSLFSHLRSPIVDRWMTEGLPTFPVPPDVYYGPGHELPRCEN